MNDRTGIFLGEDPFQLTRDWIAAAEPVEPNDPNAIALSTVDENGLPNARMVLLKSVETDAFVFFTNYESAKGHELAGGKAAFVWHSKALRRQIRVRGTVARESEAASDAYYQSRALGSRIGAWASQQSRPLTSKTQLAAAVAKAGLVHGLAPKRPPYWGGFRLTPVEIEFWADGEFRLHDRFRWSRDVNNSGWNIGRLYP